jgi:hypothetical protein
MRAKHKPLTNQTDHSKTYLFFSKPLALAAIILLAAMIGCDKCNKTSNYDNNNLKEKKPLKFQLTAPEKALTGTTYGFNPNEELQGDVAMDPAVASKLKITIDVIEGEDDSENYQFKLLSQTCFTARTFTGGSPMDLKDHVTLSKPTHNSTLKDAGLGSSLKKGDKKDVLYSFKGGEGNGRGNAIIAMAKSVQADVEIVDKAGNSVSNKVTLYWYAKYY